MSAPDDIPKLSFSVSGVPQAVGISELFWLDVEVTKATSEPVYPYPPFPVRLAYHWIQKTTRRMIVFDGDRSGLFPCVHANATMHCPMTIIAPNLPGEYILQTSMVHEGVCWFEEVRPDILREFVVSVTAEKTRKRGDFARDASNR